MVTSQRLEEGTNCKMKEKTDGKGRLKKIRQDSRAVGERTCPKVYHYFVLVHRKTPRLRNGSYLIPAS